jgi:hypothetical protein
MRVRLIPTGQMELLALARCLQRIFPGHAFETVSAREDPDGSRVPFDGFTSVRLHPGLRSDALRRLVEERRGSLSRDRVALALQQRASFHVAVPMIESWLFGDEAALRAAGVPPERLPARLAPGRDPEQLETDDALFSSDDGSSCTALAERSARRRQAVRPRWVLPERPTIPLWRREMHPKAYLSWLCRDPANERCSTYRESEGGAAALASLSWPAVLGTPSHFGWARALVHDLARALNEPVPAFAAAGACAKMPFAAGAPVLRNL